MSSSANLFAALLFGSVGFAAFMFGKKSANWKPMTVGAILMIYPSFIKETWLLYAIGVALCAGLFVLRD